MAALLRVLQSLGGVALFVACGMGVVAFVPALRAKPLARRLAWAWLLGVAWTGLLLFSMSHVAHTPLRRGTILPVMLLPPAAALFRLRLQRGRRGNEGASPPVSQAPFEPVTVSAIVAVTLISVALFLHALSYVEDGFDPMMTWDTHARYVRAARTVDAPAFFDETVFLNNPRYPLLLPLMQVTMQEVFDTNDDERIFRPAYAMFFPAFLLVLFDTASTCAGRRAAALAALVASLLPILSFNIDGGAMSSYSDFPLGCFWAGGFLLLLSASPPSFSTAAAAGLLFAAAVHTKAEGLLLAGPALAIAAAFTLVAQGRAAGTSAKRVRAAAPFAAAGLIVLTAFAIYLSWRRLVPDRFSYNWGLTTLSGMVRGTVSMFPKLLGPIASEMGHVPTWERFWWLAPFVFVPGWRALGRRVSWPLVLAIASGLSVYFLSYGGTTWDAVDLVHPTWNRFMIQLSLPFFVLFALCLREVFFTEDAEEAAP